MSKDELASFFAAKDAANGNAAGKDPNAKVAAIFDKIDTDADGKLTSAEVAAFDAARKAKKQGADATTQDTFAQITK
ncbi:hypothetical protein, partial [Salmonella enterica]|uniref:hypothetical protein n=1 Tax=Salmonella enterica TaxID=28901 RepID=UPI0035261958